MISSFANPDGEPNYDAIFEQITMQGCLAHNDRTSAESLISILGGGQLRAWQWSDAILPPSWCVWQVGNDICLNIAGTCNLSQLRGEIVGTWSTPYRGYGCRQHSFIAGLLDAMRADVVASFPANIANLRINVSGHSLGAMVATQFALELARQFGIYAVRLLCFAPAKSLTEGFTGPLPSPCLSVFSDGDGVGILPPRNLLSVLQPGSDIYEYGAPILWKHYGNLWVADALGAIRQRPASRFNSAWSPSWLLSTANEHGIENYMERLKIGWQGFVGEGRGLSIVPICDTVRLQPNPQNTTPALNVDSFIDVPNQNQDVFAGNDTVPLTLQNHETVDNLAGEILSVQLSSRANIFEQRETMPNASGNWKISLIISDSIYGHSESHVWAGGSSSTIDQARVAAEALAGQRGLLFGNKNSNNAGVIGLGVPGIPYIRIADAVNPRKSQLFSYGNDFIGKGNASIHAADFGAVCVSKRMVGLNDVDGVTSSYSNLLINFQPDDVCEAEIYNGLTAKVSAAKTWDEQYRSYLQYLIAPPNGKLGYMGNSQLTQPLTVKTFVFANTNLWQMTCTGHGFVDGDKVRLFGVNVPGYGGVYRIIAVDANTIALINGPSPRLAPATLGKIRRIQQSNGTRVLQFYAYTSFDAGDPSISKKNPARAFCKVSFKKKKRKVA